MKTKRILYISLISVLLFASCKKDNYLNRVPLSDISPATFFNNETDLQLYCNGYYQYLPVQNLLNADDTSDNKANTAINSFLNNTYTVPSSNPNPNNNKTMTWDFTINRACNYFLANYSKATISDSIKAIYVGETLFFRAMDFWYKVKLFGDVPYINKYITDTSTSYLNAPRTPHAQVMDSVLKDLNYAVAHLPVAAQDGRVSKYMALALEARVCLWEGTYRKYFNAGDPTTYLQTASAAAEVVMNSGKYSLYTTGNPKTDYYNLFIQTELLANPEAIMSKRFIINVLTNNLDRSLGEAGDGYSKDYVRSYLCTDGLPTSLSPLYKGDDSLDEEIINRDPRFTQQIATRGFDLLNGDIYTLPRIGTSATGTGYMPIKGRSNSLAAWNANQSEFDFFIFRYAETLLIEAEATAEMGTCTQSTLDLTINKLRDRVGMPHMVIASLQKDPKSDFPDLPVLLDEIRRERRIELASDGFRLDDIHRWNAGTLINNPETILGVKLLPNVRAEYPASQVSSVVVDANSYVRVYPSITARTWTDKLYLFPIPTQELTLNPNIKQNTGW